MLGKPPAPPLPGQRGGPGQHTEQLPGGDGQIAVVAQRHQARLAVCGFIGRGAPFLGTLAVDRRSGRADLGRQHSARGHSDGSGAVQLGQHLFCALLHPRTIGSAGRAHTSAHWRAARSLTVAQAIKLPLARVFDVARCAAAVVEV